MLYKVLFGIIVFLIILSLIFANQLLQWFSAKLAKVSVSLLDILRLRFSSASSVDVMRGLILSEKAGLNISFSELKRASENGASIQNIVLGMVAAKEIGTSLDLDKAMDLDKKNINILNFVKSAKIP